MEMVSTAKMKKVQGRLANAKSFELKLTGVLNNLFSQKDAEYTDPLLYGSSWPTKILIFFFFFNRGLCGSFNSNIMKNTARFKEDLFVEGKEASIYSVGKKGMNYYAFTKQDCYKAVPNLDDSLLFGDAARFAEELINLFRKDEFHEVYISYSKVLSHSGQKPEIIKLLPVSQSINDEEMDIELSSGFSDYFFEPDADKIFSYLVPLFLKMKIYTCFLETSYSEFFARRVAMKNATDASNDMINALTIAYNRVRQAKITNEISEIIGGAAGLE
jgi:F-type H+-transporting ATPase subunit gamma